eukprot:TRINITY_DN14697_c0_g1_i1.p1 TRINITY_DN14697_c0_g1~~TRINITY_DN14697_c0_g1_i1.p1  ORF type:complete len:341 (+),score=48.63 TRINITY_DN14697_c0_g1_i1:180-1202(+)
MTGDVFAAVKNHTILSKNNLVEPTDTDESWFDKGVKTEGPLLSKLFTVRTEAVARNYPADPVAASKASASYLSGIMIGDEVRSGLEMYGAVHEVTVIGASKLCGLYKRALGVLRPGGVVHVVENEAALVNCVKMMLPRPVIPELVAILRGVRPDEVVEVGRKLVEGGVRCIEVPLNSPSPFESIKRLVDEFKHQSNILIGAGTVLTEEDVEKVAAVGGRLIVSPNVNPNVIRRAHSLALTTLPGVYTPTDAFTAISLNVTNIKLFPAETLGPTGLKALKAVLPPTVKTFAVGGVTPENMSSWRRSGAYGFGIGSALYKPGDSPEGVKAKAVAFVTGMARL